MQGGGVELAVPAPFQTVFVGPDCAVMVPVLLFHVLEGALFGAASRTALGGVEEKRRLGARDGFVGDKVRCVSTMVLRLKAFSLISVTLDGIVTFVIPLQQINALAPMLVRPSEISTAVMNSHTPYHGAKSYS